MCAYISKATPTNGRGDRLIASVQATQGDQMKMGSIGDSSFEDSIFFRMCIMRFDAFWLFLVWYLPTTQRPIENRLASRRKKTTSS